VQIEGPLWEPREKEPVEEGEVNAPSVVIPVKHRSAG
jgi:hypothetical protein